LTCSPFPKAGNIGFISSKDGCLKQSHYSTVKHRFSIFISAAKIQAPMVSTAEHEFLSLAK
jgi:hypothetical protein